VRLDLVDQGDKMGYLKGHFDKTSKKRIDTPHVKKNIYKFDKRNYQFKSRDSYSKSVKKATQEDLNRAVEIINSKF
jgi:hypothetical protein